MKTYQLFTTIFLILSSSLNGALFRLPVRVSPIGGSQSFQLTDNVGASISVSGETLCTRDIPISGCISSIIVRGGNDVEFLLTDSGSTLNLVGGDILSDQPAQGAWGTSLLNRFSFIGSRSSPRNGTFSSEAIDFIIGFRVAEPDGSYRYGWLEYKPVDFNSFGAVAFNDSVTGSLVISSVPEPSSALLIALAVTIINWRTRCCTTNSTALASRRLTGEGSLIEALKVR